MTDNIKDLTTGNLWKKMFFLAVPLIIANMLQAIYNIADMIIVGHFAGAPGLSAVTVSGHVTQVVLCVVIGISNAGAVMVAQLAGAKRQKEISSMLGTMFCTFLTIAVVLMAIVLIFARPILMVFNTPVEAFEQAIVYLRICMIGTIFIYMYNLLSAILRGIGETKAPMLMVLVTTILNIVLDLIFVGALHLNAPGAGMATVISQVVSACLIISYMLRKTDFLHIDKTLLSVNKEQLKTLLKVGLPQCIQFTLTNLSFLFIAGLVNVYGVYASAATGAVTKLGTFAVLSAQAVMAGVITMAGQNIAAKQFKRMIKGMFIGMCYSLPITILFWLLSMVNPELMLGIFTKEAEVVAVGTPYLQVVAISFVVEAVMFCMFGVVIGSGYAHVSMCCAILSSFIVRYTLARVLSTFTALGFLGIAWAYPFAPMCSCIICTIFLLSGRWKVNRIRV